jgi:glycosyltransferase involved in cell wall biosynthesis
LLYYLWFEKSIPRTLKKIAPDLFFSPDGYLSLSSPVKSMNVFHDLNFEHYPEDLPRAERWFYKHYFPLYAKKACRIATVSEFSKRDIINQYKIDPGKIDVVYNGANENYRAVDPAIQEEIRSKYTFGKPYFVFIGALHPRKNLANLFSAYDFFRRHCHCETKLLLVGHKKWWTPRIRQAYEQMHFKEEVIFCGRLTPDELRDVLGSALALTYVSYFEGFGIPILEAFYCETPVITSNVTSMPEVSGDAAVLVDPFSVRSISDGLEKVASDPSFRQELIRRGRERRDVFSWQRSADLLWASMEKALEDNN